MTKDLLSVPQRWADGWSSSDPQPWLDLYANNANYIDHAFRISRTGHEVLRRHHSLWRTANPDFKLSIDPSQPVWWRDIDHDKGNGQCSIRTINTGTYKNHLRDRPPTGRSFEFSGVVDFIIEGGLIVQVNEWYTIEFSESVPVAQYT